MRVRPVRSSWCRRAVALAGVATLAASSLPAQRAAAPALRRLTFETADITQPQLTAFADGSGFVYTLLGHLFRTDAGGNAPEQLTFGPWYDSDPVLSPDGKRIAFISNRDGSDGNLYVYDLVSRVVKQVTHEFQAGLPAWSLDGQRLAYVAFLRREEYPADRVPSFGAGDTGTLSEIAAAGGPARRIGAPRIYGAVFYLGDGRLAWTVAERPAGAAPNTPLATVVEARSPEGAIARIGGFAGRSGRVSRQRDTDGFWFVGGGNLRRYRFGDTAATTVAPFPGTGTALATGGDGATLFAAADAKLWRVPLTGVTHERAALPVRTRVQMDVVPTIRRPWHPDTSATVAIGAVLTPRLSPDGRTLVFMAAGALWRQALTGSAPAERLLDETAYQLDPAISPDGGSIAFIADRQGTRELRVFDVASRKTRTIASVGGYSWLLQPTWSGDGRSVVVQRSDALGAPYRFLRVPAEGGDAVELARGGNNWNGRPHLSANGDTLFFTARAGMIANAMRQSLAAGAAAEPITDLVRHAHDALVSPDGRWLALRRNDEILLARRGSAPLRDADFTRISLVGGRSFAFTPDSRAIVCADGARVLRVPLAGGAATPIPVRLAPPRKVAPALLVSRVRVLDLAAGRFGEETSMLLQGGRIVWIGDPRGRALPADVTRLDAGGRFAMPGLMDSHTHAAWTNQQITEDRLIAYGVTSVRDVGSRLDIVRALNDRAAITDRPIPRYFASGDIFEGLIPLWGDAFLEIVDTAEAHRYVRLAKARGAAFVKVYASLPWFLKTEVAAEAHRQGMPVVGHGLSLEEIVRSVNFGIASLEHGGPNNDDIVKLLAAAGTRLDPTPTVFGAGTTLMLADSTNLDERFRTFTPADEIAAARPGRPPSEAQLAGWRTSLANYRRIHENGVALLDGTDALMTGVFHGPSVHWVLQFYAQAGIPAIDVLRIATTSAAEIVGADRELGTLRAGAVADLVLLDADPLAEVKNTLRIWRVIAAGRPFDPATMRRQPAP